MKYKNYNDYELIYMVRENDDDSKNILYQKYLPIIHSIAHEYYYRFCKYGFDYDDFFQEAMISFQKALIAYDENKDSLFYTFVTLCMRRSLLSFCRNISNTRYNISNENMIELGECQILDDKTDMNKIFQSFELSKIIKNVIYSLPLESGAIMELRLNGFNYREIGILLDIPSSSVEFKSRRARKDLRQAVRNYFSSE